MEDLYAKYSKDFRKVVDNVFGEEYPELADQLRANVSRFAAYKSNYVKTAFEDNSKAFSGDDLKAANEASKNQFRSWTETELATASARARTAKQFSEFNEPDRNELFPCLKWLPSRAANPRITHTKFYDRIWRKDDPFWNNNAPGTEWNCMCDVEECDDQPTDNSQIKQPDIPKGLEGNPASTGEVFTDNASYIAKCKNPSVPEAILKPIMERHDEFVPYLKDKNYTDQKFDWESGGYKAVHKGHNFDQNKGWYEKAVAEAGMKSGNYILLTEELDNVFKKRFIEGLWNDEKFEISGKETATSNNIRDGLKHCAKKPNTKIAVLFFPNNNFQLNTFYEGLKKYNGLKNDERQWKHFEKIICIQNGTIIYEKSHSLE